MSYLTGALCVVVLLAVIYGLARVIDACTDKDDM